MTLTAAIATTIIMGLMVYFALCGLVLLARGVWWTIRKEWR